MLNHCVFMGRLTADPVLRYTQNQVPVASFTLAVDRDISQGNEKQAEFIPCIAWRKTGEFVNNYFRKGSMAVVAGRLQIRDWEDKQGNKRKAAEIICDSIYFGESRQREEGRQKLPDMVIRDKPTFVEMDEDGELPF